MCRKIQSSCRFRCLGCSHLSSFGIIQSGWSQKTHIEPRWRTLFSCCMECVQRETSQFMETVREVSINNVAEGSNIITSHVTYKFKANYDRSLNMKARIWPNGNTDKYSNLLKTNSVQCPPTDIRILASINTIMKRPFSRIDFVSAFRQNDFARGDVYCDTSPWMPKIELLASVNFGIWACQSEFQVAVALWSLLPA